MTAEVLLSELVAALQPEGSDLRIQKANADNLDWTFRGEYNNGVTGAHVSCKAASLEDVLKGILAILWQAS